MSLVRLPISRITVADCAIESRIRPMPWIERCTVAPPSSASRATRAGDLVGLPGQRRRPTRSSAPSASRSSTRRVAHLGDAPAVLARRLHRPRHLLDRRRVLLDGGGEALGHRADLLDRRRHLVDRRRGLLGGGGEIVGVAGHAADRLRHLLDGRRRLVDRRGQRLGVAADRLDRGGHLRDRGGHLLGRGRQLGGRVAHLSAARRSSPGSTRWSRRWSRRPWPCWP